MIRKFSVCVFVCAVFISLRTAKISAQTISNEKKSYMEQTHTLGFEKFYDEEGNLLQETVLDTKEYQSRVQTFNIEKNHHENSIKLQNIQTINKMKKDFSTRNFVLNIEPQNNHIRGDGPPEFEDPPPGGGGTPPPDGGCSVYSYLCEKNEAYTVEYSTHTTRIKVYLNNISPQNPSIKVKSELKWDIMPNNRMVDVMSVSYDGNQFDPLFDSINARIEADYFYFEYYIGQEEPEAYEGRTMPEIFYFGNKFKWENNGIIFNANISSYENIYFKDEFCTLIKTFSNLTICVEFNLIKKNGPSIKDSSLNSTILQAQYVHFWQQLNLNPSLNLGIGITGPSLGISINPSLYPKHDNPRTNSFQFLFYR